MASGGEAKLATLDDALEFLSWCDNKVENTVFDQEFDERWITEISHDLVDGSVKAAAVMETPCLSGLWEQKVKSQKTSVAIHQKKSRLRKSSSSSTSIQRKKQAETRMLSEEAIKLHGYVKQLKRMRRLSKRHGDEGKSSFVDMKSSGSDSLMWHQRATSAYDKRHLSEQTNRRLKEILSNQERTYNTLNDIFKRRDLFDVRNGCGDYRFVASLGLANEHVTSNEPTSFLLSQLDNQVEKLYREVDTNFQPMDPHILYCALQPKFDEQTQTQFIEFLTATPVDISNEDACNSIWTAVISKSAPESKENSFRRKETLMLQHRNCVLEFDTINYTRKFVEQNRIIIVWSEVWLLFQPKLQYRSYGYTVITAAERNSTRGCVVQTRVKLHKENGDICSSRLQRAHNIAIGALSVKIQHLCRSEQNRLVKESLQYF